MVNKMLNVCKMCFHLIIYTFLLLIDKDWCVCVCKEDNLLRATGWSKASARPRVVWWWNSDVDRAIREETGLKKMEKRG